MRGEKRNKAIWVLSILVVILALVLIYFFIIQPQYDAFVDEKRLEGIDMYIGSYVIPQIQATGYLQVPIGNQTLILVPYVPQQAPAQ